MYAIMCISFEIYISVTFSTQEQDCPGMAIYSYFILVCLFSVFGGFWEFLVLLGSIRFYYVLLRSMPMLSSFSDVLLLCFSASIASRLFVLFLILCFSAFCFPCFSSFFFLLALYVYLLFSSVMCPLLLYFLLLCCFASCHFAFQFLLLYSFLFVS